MPMFALHCQINISPNTSKEVEVIVTCRYLKSSMPIFRKTKPFFRKTKPFLMRYPDELIRQHQEFTDLIEKHMEHLGHSEFLNHNDSSNQSSGENSSSQDDKNNSLKDIEKQLPEKHEILKESIKEFFNKSQLNQKIDELSQKIDVIFIHCDDLILRRLFYQYIRSFNEENYREKGIVYLIQKEATKKKRDYGRNLIIKENENHNINVQLVFGNCQGLAKPSDDISLWNNCRRRHKEINILNTLENVDFIDFRNAIRDQKIDILYIKTHEHIEDKQSKIYFKDGAVSISNFCEALGGSKEINFIMLMSCKSHEIAEKIIQKTKVNNVLAAKEIVHNDVLSEFLKEFLELFNYTSKKEVIIASIVRQALNNINSPNNPLTATVPVLTLFQAEGELPLTFITRPKKNVSRLWLWLLSLALVGSWIFFASFFLDQRRIDSLEYTVDVYNSKKQRFTGTFVDKSENDSISTSHKKYTYKVILHKDKVILHKDIEDNQKLTIKTNKETVQGDIEYDQYAFPEGYDKFLIVSFQSDEEYSFPEIETQVLKEFLSSSNTYLPLVEETRIIIYRKEPNSPSLFQPELGVLIAKEEPEDRSTNKDKKFLYYGYAKNSGLVKLLQDNLIQIEIHTFENEQFKNKNELTQLPETSNVSRGFNLDYSSDKQYIFFSFSTDENYQCFKMNQKITSLPDLAKNYHKYLPFLKSSK